MLSNEAAAKLLHDERTQRHLSQADLASRAGLPLRTYQRLEAGDPGARLATFLKVLGALGLELVTAATRRPTLDELSQIYGHESDD